MKQYIFGQTKEGDVVIAYCLQNSRGASAVILNYGCIIQSLMIPSAAGELCDVVLGYDTVLEYEENSGYVGAILGRVANRVGKSEFTLNGKTYKLAANDGDNHLHGGIKGFDKYIWDAEICGNVLELTRVSPSGEEGYPGSLSVKVSYELTDANELKISYDADTDEDTIVNLANHSYFNLSGGGSALRHYLQMFAEKFTENDEQCLPTGRFLSTEGTPMDFKVPKQIGCYIDADDIQLINGHGYDHNFVLSDTGALKKAAILSSRETGISMTTFTSLPGVQLYSGNWLTPRKGKNGSHIDRRYAVCLETQIFPNAMGCQNFPSPVLRKDEHYHSETVYKFDLV